MARIYRRTQNTKTNLHDPDNDDDVITDLEPDIVECEVKWALESITKTHVYLWRIHFDIWQN